MVNVVRMSFTSRPAGQTHTRDQLHILNQKLAEGRAAFSSKEFDLALRCWREGIQASDEIEARTSCLNQERLDTEALLVLNLLAVAVRCGAWELGIQEGLRSWGYKAEFGRTISGERGDRILPSLRERLKSAEQKVKLDYRIFECVLGRWVLEGGENMARNFLRKYSDTEAANLWRNFLQDSRNPKDVCAEGEDLQRDDPMSSLWEKEHRSSGVTQAITGNVSIEKEAISSFGGVAQQKMLRACLEAHEITRKLLLSLRRKTKKRELAQRLWSIISALVQEEGFGMKEEVERLATSDEEILHLDKDTSFTRDRDVSKLRDVLAAHYNNLELKDPQSECDTSLELADRLKLFLGQMLRARFPHLIVAQNKPISPF